MKPAHAFLFPGQGAQFKGMAVDLVEAAPEAGAVFDRGREVLGFDILEICREGSGTVDGLTLDLNSTRVSQPAIFLHSMAALEVLERRAGGGVGFGRGLPAAGTAGLSLGEYSALVFAGVIEFEDALRLVMKRGEFMQAACDARDGAMASVIGPAAALVEEVISALKADGHEVGIANYNSPEQTVISGTAEGVREAMERLRDAGSRTDPPVRVRTVPLRVAGAYHSPLMAAATREMEPLLDEVRLASPRLPFYANYHGRRVDDPEEIRRGLVLQIENSVRWEPCIGDMVDGGVEQAIEVGPGKVLAGLVRKIDPGLRVEEAGTAEALDKLKVVSV